MTKRWSSTRSDLTQTKREAAKKRRREEETIEEGPEKITEDPFLKGIREHGND